MTSLEFSRLPLVEVALRLSLAEPLPVNLTKVAELHRQLRPGFALVEDVAETEVPPGRGLTIEFGPAVTRAARYAGHDQGLVATLQAQMLALRWVRRSHDNYPPYPRFEALLEALLAFSATVRRVTESRVACDVASMTYVNFVRTPAKSVGDSLRHYFTDQFWSNTVSDDAAFHELNLGWSEQDADLRVIFARGEALFDGHRESGFRLVTVAGKRFAPTESPEGEVRGLHERLQQLFLRLISQEAKQEWGYDVQARVP